MRVLPDAEPEDVTVTYARFADHPGFKDLPKARGSVIYLRDLTPEEGSRLKTMTAAELKVLAKRQAKERGRKAVRP
jgi:hypothetical protein